MNLKERAREMRREGHTLAHIAETLNASEKHIGRACFGVTIDKRPRIDWDGECYRIYVYQRPANGKIKADGELQAGITWWPLSWLRFATREVAETHLAMYGDYASAA